MRILQSVDPVALTDTFSQWRDTFNIVLDGIQDTEFVTNETVVTIDGNQSIDDQKTFNASTIFKSGISIDAGSSLIGGTILDVNTTNFNITSSSRGGNVNFIGVNGISLLSTSGIDSFNFGFNAADTPELLKLTYEGDGTFEVDSSVLLHLSGTSPKIKFGNSTWNLPNSNPIADSILRWNTANENIIWQTNDDLADSLTPTISSTLLGDTNFFSDIGDSLSADPGFITDIGTALTGDLNFINDTGAELLENSDFTQGIFESVENALSANSTTLAVELIPVGSTIDIDATAVADWPSNDIDIRFPGWLLLDGRTITIAENAEFADLIKLIANNPSATTATLSDSTTGSPSNFKIIKYKKDPIATFSLDDGNGISFTRSGQAVADISLTSGISTISLKVNSSDFTFNSGNLTLASNVARRITSGALQSGVVPSDDTDLTNKLYVDTRITNTTTTLNSSITLSNARITDLETTVNAFTQATFGSTITFGEEVDGLGYNDPRFTISMINRDGVAIANNDGSSSGIDAFNSSLYAFKVLSNGLAQFKKSFNSVDQHFYVDQDDIIYAAGNNKVGQIGQTNRGISGDYIEYYNQSNAVAAPYSVDLIEDLLPALLPEKAIWPANAVTADYITGLVGEFGSTVNNSNLTIKTKDGIEKQYIGDNVAQGFIKYFDTNSTPRAYTRGYILSIGNNTYGQFGNGLNTAANTKQTGPIVWGSIGQRQNDNVNFSGRTLWFQFGLTNAELNPTVSSLKTRLANSSFREQLFKRFNWFKPNSVLAGGLASSDVNALSAWRTQTGLNSGELYNDYSWFIKKVFRTQDAQYTIIGKPGTELLNELWCAGRNTYGAMGNGSSNDQYDFLPILKSPISFNANTYTTVGNTSPNKVFRKTDNTAHGFSDFERLTLGTAKTYIIITGNDTNENRTTQFRLIDISTTDAISLAVKALLEGTTATTGTGLASLAISGTTTPKITDGGSYRSKFKGVYDIHAISKTSDTVLLKTAITETANVNALDMLPESSILTNKVYSIGRNYYGECAVGSAGSSFQTISTPTETQFTGNTPSKIIKILTISDRIVAGTTAPQYQNSASLLLDSDGRIWTCGSTSLGLSSYPVGNVVLNSWTEITQNVNFRFTKLFVTNLSSPNATANGITKDDVYPRLFAIANNRNVSDTNVYLFAAGSNHNSALGSSRYINAYTPEYLKIKFPENPNNIVEIRGLGQQTVILCKTSGQNVGRAYIAGRNDRTQSEFISTSPRTLSQNQFRNIDRFIV